MTTAWVVAFVADGAPLEVRMESGLDPAIAMRVRRCLSGYPAHHGLSTAWLTLGGTEAISLRSGTGDAVADGELPYASAAEFPADYALFALGDWVDSASLRLGRPGRPRVHAGGFVDGADVWVIAGPSHSGKSTLVLDAVARGAGYLSEERITVGVDDDRGVLVAGLTRPLRMRPPLEHAAAPIAAMFGPDAMRDAFRHLVVGDQLERRGGLVHGWVEPTDLLVIDDDPPAAPTAAWWTRKLAELSMNLGRLGPEALVELARLVSRCRCHVVAPGRIGSVGDLPADGVVASGVDPRLMTALSDSGSAVRSAPGVVTVAFPGECLVWIPGDPPRIIQLTGSAAAYWDDVLDGRDPGGDAAPLLAELDAVGAMQAET